MRGHAHEQISNMKPIGCSTASPHQHAHVKNPFYTQGLAREYADVSKSACVIPPLYFDTDHAATNLLSVAGCAPLKVKN